MKRIVLLLLIAILCVSLLAACGGSSSNNSKTTEEITIADENGVKAVTKGYGTYNEDGFVMENTLMIEATNSTEKPVDVSLGSTSVNGYMIDVNITMTLEPGETKIYPASFNESKMEECGITTVGELSFVFKAETDSGVEGEPPVTLVETPVVTMNIDPDYKIEYDESGTVVYDKNSVKIIAKDVYDDEYMGKSVRMLVINTSDKHLDVAALMEGGKLNGKDEEISFYANVASGKRAIESLSFSTPDVKEISEVSFRVLINDYDTGDTIVEETEPVTFTL